MGGQRKSLIDVELARTEFRLDVIKLRKQLAEIGVGPDREKAPPIAVVTTREGTSIEPAGDADATQTGTPVSSKPTPAPA